MTAGKHPPPHVADSQPMADTVAVAATEQLQAGDIDAAIAGFREAVRLDPRHRDAGVLITTLHDAGRIVDAPIISLDLLPTALAAANVSVPADAKLDGVNLLPYLTGKSDAPPQRTLFWRYGEQNAIRQGDWKLVQAMDTSTKPPVLKTGLYDLIHDVAEEHDRSAAHPDKVKALKKLWDEWNRQNVPALWTSDSKDEAPPVSAGKSKK